MKTYTVINDTYANDLSELTLEQLEEMWPGEYKVTTTLWGGGSKLYDECIVDADNEVVAVETEAYNSYDS